MYDWAIISYLILNITQSNVQMTPEEIEHRRQMQVLDINIRISIPFFIHASNSEFIFTVYICMISIYCRHKLQKIDQKSLKVEEVVINLKLSKKSLKKLRKRIKI